LEVEWAVGVGVDWDLGYYDGGRRLISWKYGMESMHEERKERE